MKRAITITEVALRDGSHAIAHQYTTKQVATIAKALDEANVPYIEVSHGDGLGGSSLQYGLSRTDEFELIETAVAVCRQAKIAVLLLPGIGTVKELKQAARLGAKMARIATHVTEADISAQHIAAAKELGMETVGFLMMAHMAPVEVLVHQAQLMESYGADVVYVVDSAGALLPHEVKERVRALRESLEIEVGFHAHNNLSLAMANTLAAIEEGATRVDGSVRCLGAGAGNTQTEVLVAVLDRMGIPTGIDLYKMMDLAEQLVAPILPKAQEITRDSLTLGYAGVYSSFLLHAQRAAQMFGLDARDILIELGRRKVVGGQEDMIVDVAAEMARPKAAVGEGGSTVTSLDYEKLAMELLNAEHEKREIVRLTVQYPNMTVEEAYAIQEQLVAMKQEDGYRIIGPKMGLTSAAKMAQMGVNEPIYGYVFDYMVVPNGGTVAMNELIHPKVEAEIAFILKEDVQGPNIDVTDILAATEYIIPALEIIDSRYANFEFALPDVIADNASSSRVVFGSRLVPPVSLELDLLGVSLSINGEGKAFGAGAAVLGHPANAIAMLANMLSRKGKGLKAGEIILAGAMTEAVRFVAGDVVFAQFDQLGTVSFRSTD